MSKKLKHKLGNFLRDNFNDLKLVRPLFYNHPFGIRFDLQTDTDNDPQYFKNVLDRATAVFKEAFESKDKVLVVVQQATFNRSKIRKKSYLFKQLNNPKEIDWQKLYRPYPIEWHIEKWNRAIVETTIENINYSNILEALGYQDFPGLGKAISAEVYFINLDKKLIFNMYDDRGCDVIASDKNSISPIYKKLNHLILDYDRKQIDAVFA